MKKIWYYVILMLMVIVVLPMLIVRGCSLGEYKIPKKESKININVFIKNQNKIVKMPLEDYIKGVVAAEMPAQYDIEALKAQAVAARTYVLGRATKLYLASTDRTHNGADICTDPGHCQAWISKDTAMTRWGIFTSFKYWNSICKAVDDTNGEVIEYDNKLINPLFHSNSGGKTENVENVWAGPSEPYLKSVDSPGEEFSSEFKNEIYVEQQDMIDVLKKFDPKIELNEKDILLGYEVKKLSTGGRVMEFKMGNITMKGTDFRKIFQLKSANFTLQKQPDGKILITTYGYGHGVGMSQCGAQSMAKAGKDYKDILKHYYQGVEISTL